MRKKVYLQKIGSINESLLLKLKKSMEWTFRKYNLHFKILSYELPLLHKEFDEFKKQYNGDQILDRLKTYGESKKFYRVLGVIDQDIFSKLVDYRFGCARFSENPSYGVALISISRLKETFYDRTENLHLFELRMLKEALHELGHTFGLSLRNHCENHCVMNFSPTVSKIEEKPPFYCDSCRDKLDAYLSNI